MRDRVLLFAVLTGALTFLASLYLPWQDVSHSGTVYGGGQGMLGLLDLFSVGGNFDGWSTEAGVVASLVALVLVAATAVSVVRPGAFGDLPLFPFALAVLYLAIAVLVALHAEEALRGTIQSFRGAQYHYAYGAYLGVAAAAVALLAAAFLERARLARLPKGPDLITLLLGAGLLAAFLLPWGSSPAGESKTISFPGVNAPWAILAAVGVCLLAGGLLRSRNAVYLAVMIAVLVGATVNEVGLEVRVNYGAWTALGLSVALVAATAVVRPPARPAIPSLASALLAAAATVYVIALFLPWQEFCPDGGRCLYAATGWGAGESSAAAGTLALLVILAAVVVFCSAAAALELAVAIAILTAVLGVSENAGGSGFGWSTRYGAYIGFAAAGVLLVVALVRIRPPRLEAGRVIDRLVPVVASIACLCAIALPVWSALPDRWSPEVEVLGAWYSIAGVLLTLHLLRRWLELMSGPSGRAEELVLLPLGVLALTALALIRERAGGMTWGGWILVGLCLVLTLFGWIEQRGDFDRLRVPELLRVDRLPEPES
jgi:hypothetical protein